jgi:hypothetical protein
VRIHFRNGDLAFRPETKKECDVLVGLLEAFKGAQFSPSESSCLDNIANIFGDDSVNEDSVSVSKVSD